MITPIHPGPASQPDYAAARAWETAREAAELRGEAWVDAAGRLAALLEAATTQAERDGLALAEDVTALLVRATTEHTHRRSLFTSWAVQAWNLTPTSPFPEAPWVS